MLLFSVFVVLDSVSVELFLTFALFRLIFSRFLVLNFNLEKLSIPGKKTMRNDKTEAVMGSNAGKTKNTKRHSPIVWTVSTIML